MGEFKIDYGELRLRNVVDVYYFVRICYEILIGCRFLIRLEFFFIEIDYVLELFICKCWDEKLENRFDFMEICNMFV